MNCISTRTPSWLGLLSLLVLSSFVTQLIGVTPTNPDQTTPALLEVANVGTSQVRLTFNKPLAAPTANDASNFQINGGVTISSSTLTDSLTNVLLTVSPLSFGASYTISVQNLLDLATPPNALPSGVRSAFTAMEVLGQGIGSTGGTVKRLDAESFDITGSGQDIGGGSDRFQFAHQTRVGNFDLQVRVASVSPISSPFFHAGFMARVSTEPNSPFAAVFASSTQFGCFFESRPTAGAASTTQTLTGGFPVNYPWTYLRLRRSGNQFNGYGSHDGQTWVQLGSASLTLPSTLYVGLAVCSQDASQTTTAQFRGFSSTQNFTTGTFKPDREPLGPSSRRTGLVFSEIHFFPRPQPGQTNSLEFIELHNTGPVAEDLTDWRLSGGVDYQFPSGTKIPPGGFLVIAEDPASLEKAYSITGVLGPYKGKLNNSGDLLRLRDQTDAIRLDVTYSSRPPWPIAAAGAGHSIVLARPSYGENDPRAWSQSERVGGSPGRLEAVLPSPYRTVLINELLSHTDLPQMDFVELYNHSNSPVDLSNCSISDDASTNRFTIPPGTILGPREVISWNQDQLGFRLNAAGETIYLRNPDLTQVIDAIQLEGQENGVSTGRSPDGAPTIRRLATPTPGASNAPWRQEDIVLNEIMFNPITRDSADEYIEFYNRGTNTVDLGGWKLTRGVDYKIPPNTRVAPDGFLVVAKDLTHLRSIHPHLNASNSVGNFDGTLGNAGDHVALSKPIALVSTNAIGDLVTNIAYAVVAETRYFGGGRWGFYADGGGSSLELTDPHSDPLQASNWADSDESSKAPWETVEFTGPLNNGVSSHQPNRFRISMLGTGECLLDEIEIFKVGSTNLLLNGGFENGSSGWLFSGNHSTSFVQSSGAFAGSSCLHVVGQGDGDTGVNAIRVNIASGTAGLAANNTATIRAKVRWLAGWPEVLLRTRGNWIELPARMSVPSNLGSPGKVNSRRIPNAGPAIFDVAHSPALPRANQAVVVTARISDPNGFGNLKLRYRVEPATAYAEVAMRDDGSSGDELAGDGLYSATIPGRSSGTLVGFVIVATDAASDPVTSVFPQPSRIQPIALPASEGLIRWDDPIPTGGFGHYHIWNTQATQARRGNAMDNTFRDCTLVYGNFRIIYNAGFRDKGSPYHGGGGDYAVTVPRDELLLGAVDRVFGSTGNGGSEQTGVRGRLSAWIGNQLGIPYLHAHYVRVFRNGSQHQNISEDLEQPNHDYAENQFPGLGGEGDLHKIAIWFEFQDDNRSFDATGATLERFSSSGALKLGRYRWNWQRRPKDGTANNLTNVFELVAAANATTDYANRMLQLADMEEWMRVFAFHRITGNWDSYNYNVGQNMYAYKVTGDRWRLLPWDIDFVLGLGDGPTSPIGAGTFGGNSQDPIGARMFNDPAFRRSLWRAYIDAVNGPLRTQNYAPQIAARRNALLQNGVNGLTSTNAIFTYIEARRNFINTQLRNNDTNRIIITSNGGSEITTASPTVTLVGVAPFLAASLEVNGIPYPVTWTSQRNFSLIVPLTQATNRLQITGVDHRGTPLTNAPASIQVVYTGTVEQPVNQVVINEIQYNPLQPGSSFIELYNTSTTTPFDLSNHRLDGVGYTFPEGAIIQPRGFLVLASDRRGFATAYGNTLPVFDVFSGNLDNGGEFLQLIQPSASASARETVLSDVRYDDALPWPLTADGFGPSLQLIDPTLGAYRVGNWSAATTNDFVQATPGRPNSVLSALTPFPNVWLNEILPANTSGPVDNQGEREPFLELHNPGSESIDLSNLFLTDSYSKLLQWPFPQGTVIAPKGFLLVWLDGQPQQSTASALHANFRPNPTNGPIALIRLLPSDTTPSVVDFLEYRQLPGGRSFGSFPDGEPRFRRSFTEVTPANPNNPQFPPVKVTINELMADNTQSALDPVDGLAADWFELHNSGSTAIDLTSYRLTDNPANPNQFIIPPGYVIPPGGFLLVWADADSKQNSPLQSDLHSNFKLASEAGYIGLLAPDGKLVDEVNYGPQLPDISSGRYPDSTPGPILAFEVATPRAANFLSGGNRPPILAPIAGKSLNELSELSFKASATDPDPDQTLTFSLGADAPPGSRIDPISGLFQWTPSESQGPGGYSITIRVTDSGRPARTTVQIVGVVVAEVNTPPVLNPSLSASIDEGSVLLMRIPATDADFPSQPLRYELEPNPPAGLALDATTGDLSWTPAEPDGPGTFRVGVRVSDNGTPVQTATTVLTITVNEVNNPPVINPVPTQSIAEGTELVLPIEAVDPDSAAAPLAYSLDGNPPIGLTIDPVTGVLQWTPTEAQGPGNFVVLVRATERNTPDLSTARNFSISVLEANQSPSIAPLPDLLVDEGARIAFSVPATDLDLPPQPLAFALAQGAPAGALIDPNSGRFEWSIPADAGPSTNLITVRVSDGFPGSSPASQSFTVTVKAAFKIAINEVHHHPATVGSEFVELINKSATSSWNLSGLRLHGNAFTFTFPEGTSLAPKGLICVVKDLAAFRTAFGPTPAVAGTWLGKLGTLEDDIRLLAPAGSDQVLDRVVFRSSPPWPSLTRPPGSSLQVIDSAQENTPVANWAVAQNYNGPRSLITLTNSWKFYQSGPLDSTWIKPNFNDSTWRNGLSLFFVETAALPAPKSTPLTLGQNTYYFRGQFVLPSLPKGASLVLSNILDDGAVFYLNGAEVHRQGIDPGPVEFNTIGYDFRSPKNAVGDAAWAGPFTLPSDGLVVGTNVLAVEVHQANAASSDVVFGATLTIEGGSAAPATPGAPNSVSAQLSSFPPIGLDEVLSLNTTGITDNRGEREPWIKLVNRSDTPTPLAGLFLSDSYTALDRWPLPADVTLPPGGTFLVFADGELTENSPTEAHASFRLDPFQGSVVLSRLQQGAPAVLDYTDYTTLDPVDPRATTLHAAPLAGGALAIQWASQAGTTYTLEFKNNLSEPTWKALIQITAQSNSTTHVDPADSTRPQRYYRLKTP